MGSPSRERGDAVRRLVAANLPGYRVDSVVPVGEGTDHLAYEVNGELIVRQVKEPDPAPRAAPVDRAGQVDRAAQVDREMRLLAAVAAISPLPVPEPSFAVPEQGWLAYRRLPGEPLLDQPRRRWWSAHAGSIAATLGELLAALHAAPTEPLAALAGVDDQPLAGWRHEAAETYVAVAGAVPVARRHLVEAFLEAPPPAEGWTPVFSHNDLGIEHVLVDPDTWTVTGIIDWSDAAVVDPAVNFGRLYRDLGPAVDLGRLYRDLGPAAAHAAVGSGRAGADELASLAERAVFYARCGVLEDLAYGLQTGRARYVDKSLAAMAWLFPA